MVVHCGILAPQCPNRAGVWLTRRARKALWVSDLRTSRVSRRHRAACSSGEIANRPRSEVQAALGVIPSAPALTTCHVAQGQAGLRDRSERSLYNPARPVAKSSGRPSTSLARHASKLRVIRVGGAKSDDRSRDSANCQRERPAVLLCSCPVRRTGTDSRPDVVAWPRCPSASGWHSGQRPASAPPASSRLRVCSLQWPRHGGRPG